MEHGSAKWGNVSEICRRYCEKQYTNNLLLTQHFRMGLDGYKHKRNLNVLVVGGSGAGKSRTYAIPNIMQCNCSMVITDPKAELLRKTGGVLERNGYEVRVFDLINPETSWCYNPFAYVRDDKDVLKLINNLMQEARQYGYDGYNIDFEYVKKDFADDYLQFLRELSIACQNNGLVLSVDNYKPANHNAHYELAEQAVFVDYIVIMGYDEHYAGSDAGSVASLPFVEDGISRAVSMVPSEQVINAVPFYTRISTENAGETKSRAVGMQAAMDAMQENGATAEWDETTGQYYCTYETSAGTVQIWFEEDRSIGEKMKLYSKYKLGGVAEWKLGLETSSVWSIISNGLNYAS